MKEQKTVVKEYDREISFHLPKMEDFDDIAQTLHLSKSGQAYLFELIREIDADVKMYNSYARSKLTRDKSIKKLKELEDAAKKFREVLVANQKLLPFLIPHEALQDLGGLFTVDAINKAVDRDIRPTPLSRKLKSKLKEKGVKISRLTKSQKQDLELAIKSDAGLSNGGKLIIHVLDSLILPIEKINEGRKLLTKVGRTKGEFRRRLIMKLASEADKIIEKELSFDVKGNFFELCELIFSICGVSTASLKHLIGEVVQEMGLSSKSRKARAV
jgi:hypothetical protein